MGGDKYQPRGDTLLETVTGPLSAGSITWALPHEHLHGDFTGSNNPSLWEMLGIQLPGEVPTYADLDWTAATGTCISAMNELAALGVNLVVDWSPPGVGRNVRMLREISRRSGVNIVCASGLYRTSWGIPPELKDFDSDQLAAHFVRELTLGTEGTGVRAGFIKLCVPDEGPERHDETVYRGAARAAGETGATIGMHAMVPSALASALVILEEEGINLDRFIWAHAGRDGSWDFDVFRAQAERGIYISFDGITQGPIAGVPSDEQVLDFIQKFLDLGLGHKILISGDSVLTANPPAAQYGSAIRYSYVGFKPKLEARFGPDVTRQLMRDNVVAAYRRGERVS